MLRRERQATPHAEIRARVRSAPPEHLLPHGIKAKGVVLNVGSVQLGKLKIRVVATDNITAGKPQVTVNTGNAILAELEKREQKTQ